MVRNPERDPGMLTSVSMTDTIAAYNAAMREHNYYVYILTNQSNRVLYIGMTNDLKRRMKEHKLRTDPGGFASRYNLTKLVWYEHTQDVRAAIQTEKQLKNWRREWKIALIEETNKAWKDLSAEW